MKHMRAVNKKAQRIDYFVESTKEDVFALQGEQQAKPAWLWKGRHAKLVDGFTFTMPVSAHHCHCFVRRPWAISGCRF